MSVVAQIPKAAADTISVGGISFSMFAWISDNTSLITVFIGLTTLVFTGVYYYSTIKSRKLQDRLLEKEEIRKKQLYEMSIKEHEINMLILQKQLMKDEEDKEKQRKKESDTRNNVTDIKAAQQSLSSK